MTILNFLMGWLEGWVMFLQDNLLSLLAFASLPILALAMNRKFEDRLPRWSRILIGIAGFFFWIALAYLREMIPGNRFYWWGLQLFLWFPPVAVMASLERSETISASHAGKEY